MLKKLKNFIKKKIKWFIAGGVVLAATIATILPSNEYETIDKIITAQEEYYKINGKYLQIIPNNKLPHYETGTVSDKLGKNVPSNIRIDVYETWDGKRGYQLFYEDANNFYSIATGTQSAKRTWTKAKPQPVASSTP